ncbi:MAG: S9 family peptidase, partial [Ramlibacter sp.]
MHSYRGLAMTAGGERIAAVESVEGEAKTGARIVVRNATDGKIASTWQHKECSQCRVDGLAWSPDGKALAMIATDAKAGTATVAVLRDGKLTQAAVVKGVANTVRWSPDGRQLAFLATVG